MSTLLAPDDTPAPISEADLFSLLNRGGCIGTERSPCMPFACHMRPCTVHAMDCRSYRRFAFRVSVRQRLVEQRADLDEQAINAIVASAQPPV